MFYEMQHSLRTDLIKTESGSDFSFPPHLHDSFELITVTDGEMQVQVDKNQYVIRKGQALLVFPNQLHSLATEVSSKHFLCIFSSRLVQAFTKLSIAKLPESNLFTLDSFYLDKLMNLHTDADDGDMIGIKGLLYSICGEFHATASYLAHKVDTEQLLTKIFRFVEENYKEDCSLGALSAKTAYHYTYLSRYFKQCTGISFLDYVNRYRVDEACYMLKNNKQSVLQTAYDCGFDSLRSFNRNFKKIMGMTPCEYQEK